MVCTDIHLLRVISDRAVADGMHKVMMAEALGDARRAMRFLEHTDLDDITALHKRLLLLKAALDKASVALSTPENVPDTPYQQADFVPYPGFTQPEMAKASEDEQPPN